MDKSHPYLISLGYKSDKLHGLKARAKIKLISNYFGNQNIPKFTNIQSKRFLNEFLSFENKTKDTFAELYRYHLQINKITYHKRIDLDEHQLTITNLPSKKFYISPEWRNLRYKVLDKYGNRCQACGRDPKSHRIAIHVDHILPRSLYPEHALSITNLQILCEDCNLGKSNKFETDWT